MAKRTKAPISDVLREAIERSGVSRYALSQQVDVSESVLSRFMSGKQGITLETADRLAAILGLALSAGVSQVQPPVTTIASAKPADGAGNEAAEIYAHTAHEQHFNSRRGVWEVGEGEFCFYNNHPYQDAPERREREFVVLRTALIAAGCIILGEATYPPAGTTDAAYTRALVVGTRKGVTTAAMAGMYEKAIEQAGGAR